MVFELKKIDVLSAIKVSFIINAIIGLLVGLLIGSVMAFIMSLASQFIPAGDMGYGNDFPGTVGIFGGIFMGLVYAIFIAVGNGVILTGIITLLYNLIAGWVGGIKLNFNETDLKQVQPSATIAQSSNVGDKPADV
ncbi:MAG: hypothetical protein J7K40_15230 [candidate division Zixibacteria bacterium]|nr:hypothetical protein [candidate division Zixibacteria bacterium]